ncbi:MAG TPA: sigma-54-dependent Fis family transcriptional regulator [Verrucomicrobiales bacterium]|nr:sigma-54-dependent Fis family transcriptional regulator [Verrucomicrobiales bacterium]
MMKIALLKNFDPSERIRQRTKDLNIRISYFKPEALEILSASSSDLVYTLPFEALKEMEWPKLRVRLAHANRYYLVIGSGLKTRDVMQAARDGAFDVIDLDEDDDRWTEAIRKSAESQSFWLQLYGAQTDVSENTLIGQSPSMVSMRKTIDRLGPTAANVLILGESGVGKERVANALHEASGRKSFIAVNCGAIPRELIEAELFGAEKGAYTGAHQARPGLVEQANKGTLFLDEIGELDLTLQPKLLRFLETHQARRVGGQKEYKMDVRILSATNRDLDAGITQGLFRPDLYYRLSEIILHIPPLRSRLEDIAHLALSFLKVSSERFGKFYESIDPELIKKFQSYNWPGNAREVKNMIDRMVIYYDGPILRAEWWDPPASEERTVNTRTMPVNTQSSMAHPGMTDPINNFPTKKQKILMAKKLLEEHDGDLTWVAAQLGIHPTTLYRWRKAGKV